MKMISGKVVKGAQLGRKMGFPTINVESDRIDLEFGIYACEVALEEGVYKGAMHYGPKLNLEEPVLEIHLIDFSGDLYGQMVKINVIEKIRDLLQFENLEGLKEQIALDVNKIKCLSI